jgi:DNA modification methylase
VSAVVLRADARSLPLPDGSVDLIVTSPPYWSQRDYRDGGESLAGQIGTEATWQEYLANLLDCTREWVRVLKPGGSMFVNLGDKYANDAKWGGATSGKHVAALHGKTGIGRTKVRTGIPSKSLIGLPSRYALACLDELGLIWRRDNIWHKPSGMPESADDRCTTRHEYVHHFTLRPDYFSAVDEIREPQETLGERHNGRSGYSGAPAGIARGFTQRALSPLGKLPGSVWKIPSAPLFVPERIEHSRCCGGRKRPGCEDGLNHHAAFPPALASKAILGWSPLGVCMACGEGRRPVSDVLRTPRPTSGPLRGGRNQTVRDGHPGVSENFMRLTTITGYACACTPYTDHPGTEGRKRDSQGYARETGRDAHPHGGVGMLPRTGPWREYHFGRWTPAPTRPAVVADPFGGTGTTALVADVLGRDGFSFDRSADYCRLGRWRTQDPAERARALGVPKPPPVPDGQTSLFGEAS